ncbi:uncharacterized protein PITG_18363 [Phytophthora infestans T30-4]|uniref:Ubiquitin-like protease family profile domain-containing protein n=1 Tax=Phytophthora infestans (strain T30-4) TaxID=403677 RepID=D0NXZ6_PHYIT|nr:uncharacterized protein PITG_18363 [Phytophthora infestans T30-4]EEY67947.1 hypothetical protein PITG_18363 [Phytophthora infestans T30-4]|eukprot:XP_002997809.1 hypothetical protein PITG_18363 [Phytophthora infestans T30-4]
MEHGAVSVPMTVFADMFKNLSTEKILIPVCCNKNHWCGIMVDVERTEAVVLQPFIEGNPKLYELWSPLESLQTQQSDIRRCHHIAIAGKFMFPNLGWVH